MKKQQELSDKKTEEKKYGLELLKILSMFYLIIILLLEKGEILASVSEGSTRYMVTWLLRIWCAGTVNIFVILTGFTGWAENEGKKDWPGHLTLWLEVIFYGVLLSLAGKLIFQETVSSGIIINMCFPLINNIYWIFSLLTGVMVFKPFLDTAIRHMVTDSLKHLMLLLFLSVSCLSVFSDPFQIAGGHSLIWFILLYMLGAFIKKTDITRNIRPLQALICIIIFTSAAWLWKLFGANLEFLNHQITGDSIISLSSPLILAASVCHVILFSKLSLSEKTGKFAAFLSSGTFAVYLIGYHPVLCKNLIENRFTAWAVLRNYEIIYKIIGLALIITLCSLIIDKVRLMIFEKMKIRDFFRIMIYSPERGKTLEKLIIPSFCILFTGIWIFLFWKCPYGYGYMDEALYLTVPYRLLKFGDGLLIHEWHEFQLSTFPTLPLMMVYNLFFKNTEQILLNYRYIYTFLWGCSAFFFFARMKRFSLPGAAAASLIYLIHAPYGIMAFSYNSMGVLFLLNTFIIASTAEKHKPLQYFICGVFLAGSILCCPYLLILYFLLTIAAAASLFRKRNKSILSFWVFITLGAFCLFVIFCAFLLSRGSIQEILRAIPIVLDDVEHPDRNLIRKTVEYFDLIIHSAPMAPFILILFTLMCVISRFWKNGKDLCLSVVCLSVISALTYFTNKPFYSHYLMLPVCLIGLFCRINSDDSSIIKLFRNIWIPGIIYTFCLNYSSNQQLHALTNAATVPAFASIIVLIMYFQKSRNQNRLFRKTAIACAALFFIILLKDDLILRHHVIFFEDSIEDQTVYARSGPEKGIKMTETRLESYERTMNEIIFPIREEGSAKQVLFFVNDPVLYLCTEKGIGSFSAWLPGINSHTVRRLDLYYELNPIKIPDVIYIPSEYGSYLDHFTSKGYTPAMTGHEDYLLQRNVQ